MKYRLVSKKLWNQLGELLKNYVLFREKTELVGKKFKTFFLLAKNDSFINILKNSIMYRNIDLESLSNIVIFFGVVRFDLKLTEEIFIFTRSILKKLFTIQSETIEKVIIIEIYSTFLSLIKNNTDPRFDTHRKLLSKAQNLIRSPKNGKTKNFLVENLKCQTSERGKNNTNDGFFPQRMSKTQFMQNSDTFSYFYTKKGDYENQSHFDMIDQNTWCKEAILSRKKNKVILNKKYGTSFIQKNSNLIISKVLEMNKGLEIKNIFMFPKKKSIYKWKTMAKTEGIIFFKYTSKLFHPLKSQYLNASLDQARQFIKFSIKHEAEMFNNHLNLKAILDLLEGISKKLNNLLQIFNL